ncbi:MAG TPA: hypothetical protein VFW87_00320 [Pirellulales bacterium]|nr:hypothetical protein [Pirellulales bacterium]
MTRIVVNEALRGLLPDLTRPLELFDETGRMLGHFVPAANAVELRGEPQFSEEELRQLENEPFYTTAEVLAYLESLP